MGRDGPVLYLEAQTLDGLQKLRELFLYLTGATGRTVDLIDESYIRPILLDEVVAELVLESVPKERERPTQLKRIKHERAGLCFRWVTSPEAWETMSLRLDPFFEDHCAGHQYLNEGDLDEVGVEVCFREPSLEKIS